MRCDYCYFPHVSDKEASTQLGFEARRTDSEVHGLNHFKHRNGNPLQYSCLENPMDKGAWWATVHGVAKELDTTEQHTHTHTHQLIGDASF